MSISRYPSVTGTLVVSLIALRVITGGSRLMAATPSQATDGVVAEVEGQKITSEELEKNLAGELRNLQEQIYNLKQQKLESMINERLLTSKRDGGRSPSPSCSIPRSPEK